MTEAGLMREVFRLCDKYRLLAFHSADSRMDAGNGFPDLVISGLYYTVFAELKSDVGKLTSEQTAWMYRLKATGQLFYTWRPLDLHNGNIQHVLSTL